MRKHTDDITSFAESDGLTNAVAEGLNRIIGIIKNRASGYATVQALADLIYLTIGDIDIPAQIPARHRTL